MTDTVEHVTRIVEICTNHGEDQCSPHVCDLTFEARCACGWKMPKPTTSRSSAGFSASNHKKQAAKPAKSAPKTLVQRRDEIEAIAVTALAKSNTIMHGTDTAGDVLCSADDGVLTIAWSNDQTTCPDCLAALAQMTQPEPMTHLLPATRVLVPSDEYAIDGYREFRGMYRGEGPAFNAYLTRNGKRVATVDDAGCGGETDVYFLDVPKGAYQGDDSPEKDAFKAWVNRFTGKWVDNDPDGIDLPWSFVGVISVLVDEASMQATLKRRKGVCYLTDKIKGERGQFGIVSIPKGATREGAYAWLAKREPKALVWVHDAWVPIQSVLAA